MLKRTFILLTIVLPMLCSAQRFVIGSNADLRFDIAKIWPLGRQSEQQVSGASPALFTGFQRSTSVDLQYTHRVGKKISMGVAIGMAYFSNWKHLEAFTFSGTTANIYSFGPVASFKAPFGGSQTRLIFFITALPEIYFWEIETSDESNVNGSITFYATTPVESRCLRPGGTVATGLELAINSRFGISTSASYTAISAKSAIFPEKQIGYASLKVGLILRLARDHRYRYSEL